TSCSRTCRRGQTPHSIGPFIVRVRCFSDLTQSISIPLWWLGSKVTTRYAAPAPASTTPPPTARATFFIIVTPRPCFESSKQNGAPGGSVDIPSHRHHRTRADV